MFLQYGVNPNQKQTVTFVIQMLMVLYAEVSSVTRPINTSNRSRSSTNDNLSIADKYDKPSSTMDVDSEVESSMEVDSSA